MWRIRLDNGYVGVRWGRIEGGAVGEFVHRRQVRERISTLYMCISGNPKVYSCMWYMCVLFLDDSPMRRTQVKINF